MKETLLNEVLGGEHGEQVGAAIRELLAGELAEALAATERRRIARERDLSERITLNRWHLHGTMSASRRDGLAVELVGPYSRMSALEPKPYVCSFPPLPGGLQPITRLDATDLAGAMAEADERWPLPHWWTLVDHLPDVRSE